jgi:hypothetical protein
MKFINFILAKKSWILAAGLTLFILETAIFQPWRKPTNQEQVAAPLAQAKPIEAILSLQSEQESVKSGENFKVNLNLKTFVRKAAAFDAVIFFNPEEVNVANLETGDLFGEYPRQTFDNQQGKVAISGTSSLTEEAAGVSEGTLATITFTALKSGQAKIELIFKPNDTTDSNVIAEGSTEDILGEVRNLVVAIE